MFPKNVRPEGMTFIRLLRRPYVRGWRPAEVFSLGIYDATLLSHDDVPDDEAVREAHSYFYGGFHDLHYPHIICWQREPLVLMMIGLYVSKGYENVGEDDKLMENMLALIRPTWAFVNSKRSHVVPAPGDSRAIWTGRDHKIQDEKRIPIAVPLLTQKVFRRLTRKCPTCFLQALRFSSPKNLKETEE